MSNEELDKAAREYAEKHSSAPDKETPDWIINDFKSGAKWAMDLRGKEVQELTLEIKRLRESLIESNNRACDHCGC